MTQKFSVGSCVYWQVGSSWYRGKIASLLGNTDAIVEGIEMTPGDLSNTAPESASWKSILHHPGIPVCEDWEDFPLAMLKSRDDLPVAVC